MVHVSILALKNAVLASIADARYVFTMVNEFMRQAGKEPVFEVQVVGMHKKTELEQGLFTMVPDELTDNIEQTNLIIIPSMTGNMISSTHLNKDYVLWIGRQYKNGAEVASLCTGAFLLAFSGLLKDKQCTTHWLYAKELRYFYPSVKVVDDKVITDQQGLYTSGGNNAYWNLLLHLVEKYTDRETAILTAKYFVIDLGRSMQSPFIIFHGLKDHEDEAVLNAQEYIEHNYPDKLTVDELAERLNITRRTFERRFKKATRHTVVEYIQLVRTEAAKKQLETGRKTINEVMYDVGYTDIKSFRDVFKKIAGMSPVEYRNRYNKESQPSR